MAGVMEHSREMLQTRGQLSPKTQIAILESFKAVIKSQFGAEESFVPGFRIQKSGTLGNGAIIMHYHDAMKRIDERLSKLGEG